MLQYLLACCLVSLTVLCSACRTTTVSPISKVEANKIDANGGIYIVTPADGTYETRTYKNSGLAVVNALNSGFGRHSTKVIVGPATKDRNEALRKAREQGCAYVAIPTITHWEDRATEWSGKSDRIEILLKLLSASDCGEIATAVVKGKSAWLTFGGDHPQDMVRAPVCQWVHQLYTAGK